MKNYARCSIALTLLLAAVGCNKKSADEAPAPTPAPKAKAAASDAKKAIEPPTKPEGQWYRATLSFDELGDDGRLPFFFFLPKDGGEAWVKNGAEKVPMDHKWDGTTLEMVSRWNYPMVITAKKNDSGSLEGMLVRDFPLWGHVERAFAAEPVADANPSIRFASIKGDATDVSGVWKFNFDHHGESKAKLSQKDGVVTGVIRPGWLGDLRFMAGNVGGGKLGLSTFNGNSANLVVATLSEDGSKMEGTMSMLGVWNEPFTAERSDDWALEGDVHLKKGKKKLSDPIIKEYAGKPLVLFYFATWCPSCNDATPYFVELHKKYAEQGVEFVSIAYDLSEDEESNQEQLDKFLAKYGITWRALQRPTTPEKWGSAMAPELEGWDGFPVTLFVKPDGTLHKGYGGWYGPAAPDENKRIKANFDKWTSEIVAAK